MEYYIYTYISYTHENIFIPFNVQFLRFKVQRATFVCLKVFKSTILGCTLIDNY